MGRNVEPMPLNPSMLGDWQELLFESPHPTAPVTLGEAFEFVIGSTGKSEVLRQKIRLAPRVIKRRLTGQKTMGVALTAGLLKGCRDVGVRALVNTRARGLIMQNGKVAGVRADTKDGEARLGARKTVILATGGFEWNRDLVGGISSRPGGIPPQPRLLPGETAC